MRKKLLALAGAVVLSMAMSLTAFAAPSPTAEAVATTTSGQVISEAVLAQFVEATNIVTDVQGAKIGQVGNKAAVALVNVADAVVGTNATVMTMVDIDVPEGTGSASFTLEVPGLVAGQSVYVLHVKSDSTVELLPVTAVGNGSVTFTMTSYSPVAVVVNASAPKTGEANATALIVIAMTGAAGAFVFGKKYAKN